MRKMRRGVAHRDRARHAKTCQNFSLACHWITWRIPVVELQVHHRRGHIFHCRKSHIVGRSAQHFGQQRLWHRFTGLRMCGELGQHFGHLQPVFIQLAWQLNKVARDRSARHTFIGHIRQHLVQRMTKLMEQCARIIIGQ